MPTTYVYNISKEQCPFQLITCTEISSAQCCAWNLHMIKCTFWFHILIKNTTLKKYISGENTMSTDLILGCYILTSEHLTSCTGIQQKIWKCCTEHGWMNCHALPNVICWRPNILVMLVISKVCWPLLAVCQSLSKINSSWKKFDSPLQNRYSEPLTKSPSRCFITAF